MVKKTAVGGKVKAEALAQELGIRFRASDGVRSTPLLSGKQSVSFFRGRIFTVWMADSTFSLYVLQARSKFEKYRYFTNTKSKKAKNMQIAKEDANAN